MYPLGNQRNTESYGSAGIGQSVQTIAKDPQRITIPTALDEQREAVSQLHGIISELENRLAAVLHHDQAGDPTSPPSPESPQILDRIGMHTRGVNGATTRIMSLMKRLHL